MRGTAVEGERFQAGMSDDEPPRMGLSRFDAMPPDVPLEASEGPFIHAFRVSDGKAVPLGWPYMRGEGPQWDWLHLDRTHEDAEPFLRDVLGLGDQVVEGLLDAGTRPRLTRTPEGILLILRGVNHNEGRLPDEMVALRFWIAEGLVVTFRRSPLLGVHEMRDLYSRGVGPATIGDFLSDLIEHMTDRAGDVVADLMKEMDRLEDRVIANEEDDATPGRLSELRRRVVRLLRFLQPQRDALESLGRTPRLFDEVAALDLTESREQCQRIVEELESARERAIILTDELRNRADERVARHSYLLSVAAGIFLPITFLTGLLGINVGGIPGTGYEHAFWVVVGICGGIAVATLAAFLIRRWF